MGKIIFMLSNIMIVNILSFGQSRISVSGNKFINEQNQPILFKGYSTSDPDKLVYHGHWNQEYFNEIKAWGANIVRFPVHPQAWRKHGKNGYQNLLDQGIDFAQKAGLYVIIDWHSIGNLKSALFQSPNYDTDLKETFEFWQAMASRYKDNTTVAFFELFNEPTVNNGQLGVCSWEDWKKINEEMITIIRAHGAKTVPLVAGFNWAYDLTEAGVSPISAEGIGYVSHPYPMKRPKPWEDKWTADWGFMAATYPLILTEVGFCGADDIGAHVPVVSDESYGDAMTSYCKNKGISLVAWVFDPNWAPRLFTDWQYTPSRQGIYWKEAFRKF